LPGVQVGANLEHHQRADARHQPITSARGEGGTQGRPRAGAFGYRVVRPSRVVSLRLRSLPAPPINQQGRSLSILASSYPFLDAVGTILVFFAFVIWFWLLITIFADLFRRHDIGGGMKVLWFIFVILLPYLGVFIYLIAEHKGMVERSAKQQQAAQSQFDEYVQTVAKKSEPAEQIAQAKALLDNGTITQAEFDQIKEKALAPS
jgi:hypothetical protein